MYVHFKFNDYFFIGAWPEFEVCLKFAAICSFPRIPL